MEEGEREMEEGEREGGETERRRGGGRVCSEGREGERDSMKDETSYCMTYWEVFSNSLDIEADHTFDEYDLNVHHLISPPKLNSAWAI